MVKLEENALTITLPHPCPAEALADLQAGIIAVLKYQCANYDEALGCEQKQIDGNHLLLELLEATLNREEKILSYDDKKFTTA